MLEKANRELMKQNINSQSIVTTLINENSELNERIDRLELRAQRTDELEKQVQELRNLVVNQNNPP